jgi:hypothetical protein
MGTPEREIHEGDGNNRSIEQLKLEAAIGVNLLYSCNMQGNIIDEESLRSSLKAMANLPRDEFTSLVAQQKDGEF